MNPTELLELTGISYLEKTNRLQLCCPFHHDRNPSAGFYLDTERFFCFACELSLDIVGFYAKLHETNREHAAKALGMSPDPPVKFDRKKAETVRLRAEAELTKRKHLPRNSHASLGEKLDQILWYYQAERLQEERFATAIARWYELLEVTDEQETGTDLP